MVKPASGLLPAKQRHVKAVKSVGRPDVFFIQEFKHVAVLFEKAFYLTFIFGWKKATGGVYHETILFQHIIVVAENVSLQYFDFVNKFGREFPFRIRIPFQNAKS